MTQPDKPHWPAPERNKAFILDILTKYRGDRQFALEVGSGTGQHAVHFAQALPQLTWQCSDQEEYIEGVAPVSYTHLTLPTIYSV